MVTTLQGPGPFTVLAPSNQAFDTFLAANNFATLGDVPVDVLTQVLLNHVISGTVASSDLVAAGSCYSNTLATGAGDNNMSIYFNTANGVVFNGISTVTSADNTADNGVVHIVDTVIALPTVVTFAAANSDFSSLVAALSAADGGLVNVLSGACPFTVLSPDNDAFTTFLDGAALGDIPTDVLAQVLLNHVLTSTVVASDLTSTGIRATSLRIYLPSSSLVAYTW